MNLTANETLVVEFFRANPGTPIRALEQSVKVEDFTSPAEFRAFCKGCHSRAHTLHGEGILTRTLRLDPDSNLNVWHYSLSTSTESPTGTGTTSKGWKGKFEEAKQAWLDERMELTEQAEMGFMLAEKAEAQRDAAKEAAAKAQAEAEALRAENAKLMEWLEAATA